MSSDSEVFKFGLIGAGRWGQNYIHTIEKRSDACLFRLASRNPISKDIVSKKCIVSSDWRTLIDARDIDGLILAVPPAVQVEIAMAALEQEVPLLLEKPLATNFTDAMRIADLANKKNVPIMVDHIYLFHPAYVALKQEVRLLDSMKSIRSISGSLGPFRKEWSPLMDWGPHDLAMCLDLTGEFPSSISVQRDEIETTQGVGENFDIKLKFPSGICADLNFGNGMNDKVRQFAVECNDIEVLFDDMVNHKVVKFSGERKTSLNVGAGLALDRAIELFVEGLRSGDKSYFGADLALKVVQILVEIEHQSIH